MVTKVLIKDLIKNRYRMTVHTWKKTYCINTHNLLGRKCLIISGSLSTVRVIVL